MSSARALGHEADGRLGRPRQRRRPAASRIRRPVRAGRRDGTDGRHAGELPGAEVRPGCPPPRQPTPRGSLRSMTGYARGGADRRPRCACSWSTTRRLPARSWRTCSARRACRRRALRAAAAAGVAAARRAAGRRRVLRHQDAGPGRASSSPGSWRGSPSARRSSSSPPTTSTPSTLSSCRRPTTS